MPRTRPPIFALAPALALVPVSLLLAGCPLPSPQTPPQPNSVCGMFEAPQEQLVKECGLGNRRIGAAAGPCAGNDAWAGSALPLGHDANYCLYELKPGADPKDATPTPSAPDCVAVASNFTDTTIAEGWRDPFVRSADIVDGSVLGSREWGNVRVAVIDTAPSRTAVGTALHGRAMAGIVRDVALGCLAAEKSCEREVRTFTGLPRDYVFGRPATLTDPDLDRGGYVGYTGDVAIALSQALDWCEGDCRQTIINLSVGWDAGGSGVASPAVQELLQRASCRGAVIIAAGGNRSPLACGDVDLEPARWESLARPTDAECEALGEVPMPSEHPPRTEYRPLVHSISAVDHDDGELSTSSPGSQSRIAAIGYQVVVSLDGPQADTNLLGPMSGTSVSAAVVSGIAALVWSADPDLAGDDVMQVLWKSGRLRENVAVSRALDGAPTPEPRVVSACPALQAVCPDCPVQCRDGAFDPTLDVSSDAAARGGRSPVAAPAQQHECETCGMNRPLELHGDAPAPTEYVAGPQPGDPPCPPCWVDDVAPASGSGQASLHLQLSSAYEGFTATGFLVTLRAANGARETHYYDNDPPILTTSSLETLTDTALYDVGGEPPTSGWIEVYFDSPTGGSFSEGNELTID